MSEFRSTLNLLLSFLLAFTPFLALAEQERSEEPATNEVVFRKPRLNAVFPMAARPGERLTLEIEGEFLWGSTSVEFDDAGMKGEVVSSSFTHARILVTVPAQAETGARYFRLLSGHGASNSLIFRISRWATPAELEPNDELDLATNIQLPSLISGKLQTEEDIDLYRFHAHAGERIQFNLLAARNGISTDASLAILRPDGSQVVHDDGSLIWDPYIDHTFVDEGDFLAAVMLTRMPAGGQTRTDLNYQLGIGRSPFFRSIFPLGGSPGSAIKGILRADFVTSGTPLVVRRVGMPGSQVAMVSGQIGKRVDSESFELALAIDQKASAGLYELSVDDDSGTLAPLDFVVGDLPEMMETEPNDAAEHAQRIVLPILINGRIDRDGDADWFRFDAMAGTVLSFRVDAEKYGSPLDSLLALFNAQLKAIGSNDDDKLPDRPLNRDSRLFYTIEERGEYFIRLSSLFRRGYADQVYRLEVKSQVPDFSLSLTDDRPNVIRGGKGKIGVSLQCPSDFSSEVEVSISGLPAGVLAKPLVLTGSKTSGNVELMASSGCPLGYNRIEVVGKAMIGGAEVLRTAFLPASKLQGSGPAYLEAGRFELQLSVVEPPEFSLESAVSTVYLVRGGKAEFGVRTSRKEGFDQPIILAAENLPAGVFIESIEMVDAGRMARLTLRAEPQAEPARVSNLTIIGKGAAPQSFSTAAPKITLQLD